MWCWGGNDDGQLGNGTTTRSDTPVEVVGLSGRIVDIAVGDNVSCVVTTDGTSCFGFNVGGAVGDGTDIPRSTPVRVVGLPALPSRIAAGGVSGNGFACAIVSGDVYCWGDDEWGATGSEHGIRFQRTAVKLEGLAGVASDITAGASHACAATDRGVQCWGDNSAGQLGQGLRLGHTGRPQFVPAKSTLGQHE
jgi:alpha-tubulin suppressor-like RCC1 family protein